MFCRTFSFPYIQILLSKGHYLICQPISYPHHQVNLSNLKAMTLQYNFRIRNYKESTHQKNPGSFHFTTTKPNIHSIVENLKKFTVQDILPLSPIHSRYLSFEDFCKLIPHDRKTPEQKPFCKYRRVNLAT